MLIRNVNPLGEVEVPSLRLVAAAGEVIDVPDEVGAALLEQAANWASVVEPKPIKSADAAANPKE